MVHILKSQSCSTYTVTSTTIDFEEQDIIMKIIYACAMKKKNECEKWLCHGYFASHIKK